jgi:hypothetical protein
MRFLLLVTILSATAGCAAIAEAQRAEHESRRNAAIRVAADRERFDKQHPAGDALVVIENRHAELLVELSAAVPRDRAPTRHGWYRLEPGEQTQLADRLRGRSGLPVAVEVAVIAHGDKHAAGKIEVPDFQPGGTLTIVVDWDSAMARFRARGAWEPPAIASAGP